MNDINSLHITVLILSGFILLMLLAFLLKNRINGSVRTEKPQKIGPENLRTKPCPLCGTLLKPGERVHSVIYPGKPDSLMEIYGCPFCEKPDSPNKRKCPVCKKIMSADSVLIARVFDKPGKKHVHVLGCTRCYSGKTKISK